MKWLLYGLMFVAVFGYLIGSAYLLERFAKNEQFGRLLAVIVITVILYVAARAWSGGPLFPSDQVYLR